MLLPKNRLIGTGWKMKRESKLRHSSKESPRKSHRSMKSSSHKKKRSSRKLQKKSVHISSRKSSSKEPNLKPLLSAKSSLASWKSRKKKAALKRSSPLKENVAWKRRKKDRRFQKLLYHIFDWKPGIASLFTSPWNSSFLFRPGVYERVAPRIQWTSSHTTLIMLTVKCIT